MLIPLDGLVERYDMKISGLLHVGAHLGEEAHVYARLGIKNVTWIEGNPALIPALNRRVGYYSHTVIQALVADRSGEMDFKITNNGESSSILDLGTHKETSPQVHVIDIQRLPVFTLNEVCATYNLCNFNFLNLDLQGAELLALMGMGTYLDQVDYIYSEVNKREVYVGCAQVHELDEFLEDFERVETLWCEDGGKNHGWGDALLIRKSCL